MRPRLGVSRCLLGGTLHGGADPSGDGRPLRALRPYVELIPCTPDVQLSLTTLAELARLTAPVGAGGAARRRPPGPTAAPVTNGDLDGFVAHAAAPGTGPNPPRCACDGLATDIGPVDTPGTGTLGAGTANGRPEPPGRSPAAFPVLQVDAARASSDGAGWPEEFIEQIFARARLRGVLAAPWRPGDLVGFHSRHKLQLLAHDPERYRRAGRLVARAGDLTPGEVAARYRRLFLAAVAATATRERHANVLERAFGHTRHLVDHRSRREARAAVEAYRHGRVPRSVPLALLTDQVRRHRPSWAAGQTYLAPYPPGIPTCPSPVPAPSRR